MRHLFLFSVALALSASSFAQTKKESKASSSSNPVSKGTATMSGVSDGPLSPNSQERNETRKKAASMGGAPNVGAGMGTGTGAGSRVGNKTDED